MLRGYHGLKEAREVWGNLLTFDESIPANRVAMEEARKRLAEAEPEHRDEVGTGSDSDRVGLDHPESIRASRPGRYRSRY